MTNEISKIRERFLNVAYPQGFIDSINNKVIGKINDEDDYTLLSDLFKIPKTLISVEIPYFWSNEIKSKRFLNRFHGIIGKPHDVKINDRLPKEQNSCF